MSGPMHSHPGRVVANSDDGLSQVDLMPISACGRCASGVEKGSAGSGCGIRLFEPPPVRLLCTNEARAQPGDRVIVSFGEPPLGWLRLVALSHGLPAVLLVVGAWCGDALGRHWFGPEARDAGAVVLALLGLFAGLVTGRHGCRMLMCRTDQHRPGRIIGIASTP